MGDLAARIWGDCDGQKVKSHSYGKGKVVWNIPLDEVLQGMGVERDFVVEYIDNEDQHIDYIHRATTDEDIYFVSNSSMNRELIRCRFRVGAGRIPSLWNSEDGSVKVRYAYEVKDGFIWLTLDLAPASSTFVVFGKGEAHDSIVRIGYVGGSTERRTPELISWEEGKLTVRFWQNGNYKFETASGLTSTTSVSDVPSDQPITGPWKITFPKDRGAPAFITMESLSDWTKHPDSGVRYFSGSATCAASRRSESPAPT